MSVGQHRFEFFSAAAPECRAAAPECRAWRYRYAARGVELQRRCVRAPGRALQFPERFYSASPPRVCATGSLFSPPHHTHLPPSPRPHQVIEVPTGSGPQVGGAGDPLMKRINQLLGGE